MDPAGVRMMENLVALLVLVGCFWALLAGIGVTRFPDCYSRLHAATKAGAFGGAILSTAVGLHLGGVVTWLTVIVLIAFFYTTAPVSAHLLARASHRCGIEPAPGTDLTELRAFEEEDA